MSQASPVSKLPIEILGRCFFLLMRDNPPSLYAGLNPEPDNDFGEIVVMRGPQACKGPVLGWLTVTHTCSHWREVALKQPHLWGQLPFNLGPDWVASFLSRAQATPLSVRTGRVSYAIPIPIWGKIQRLQQAVLDTIQQHLDQIEDIHIGDLVLSQTDSSITYANPFPTGGYRRDEFFAYLATLLQRPAPVLRELCLLTNDANTIISLPPNFNAPGLTELSLSRVGISQPFPFFQSLTRLRLHTIKPMPSYEPLFHILENNPNLQVLDLITVVSPVLRVDAAPTRQIDLPHLSILNLHDHVACCAGLLRVLCFPRTTAVRVTVMASNGSESCTAVAELLAPHLHRQHPAITEMLIDGLTLEYWPGQSQPIRPPHERSRSNKPVLTLTIRIPSLLAFVASGNLVHVPALRAAVEALSPTTIRKLVLYQFTEPEVLSAFPSVRSLEIHRKSVEAISLLIATSPTATSPTATSDEGTVNFMVLPSLDFIRVCRVDLTKDNSMGSSMLYHRTCIDATLDMLRRRRGLGRPVRGLKLTGCTILEADLLELREVVPTILEDISATVVIASSESNMYCG
ncbi:uncharacterized protein STEHIDRAFT_157312 [Stereum hirsutum FP-91666 SS1]|uniref:uncharacterized protein n=1 Tax=Stereum hirsutum (strain FP-91666) TaxID=721885 RepID=UPI0004449B2C|nr:uncharacterized protein STEHIDRAFT_157312 [Stereum hirsutum FP-91666 SS1]EIM85775.1 hypothetical protein STEHIDRAFT_157312 [Stereum hirsutum FP-91666 SS1]